MKKISLILIINIIALLSITLIYVQPASAAKSLLELCGKAVKALPGGTPNSGGTSSARPQMASNNAGEPRSGTVILIDISGSMNETIDRGSKRTKFDVLQEALKPLFDARGPSSDFVAIQFSDLPSQIDGLHQLSEPGGGTALHSALISAKKYNPARTIVLSDGSPNNKKSALNAADKLGGAIEVIYIGPDDDKEAQRFMNKLAREGGKVETQDIAQTNNPAALTNSMRRILALPPPPQLPAKP